jgi:ribosomal protein L32
MNTELENLVDIAIIDGYITDKEKEVLLRKAVAMGFDVDELEMILEGKLYELNKTSMPSVNKCLSCGEIISGLSKVCPSCKYVQNTETFMESGTLQESFARLEADISFLKIVRKPDTLNVANSIFKIIFTGGLYILYKKLVKREHLFDSYAEINEKTITETDAQAESMRRKYGADPKIAAAINELITDRDKVINKRRSADRISAITTLAIMGITVFLITWAVKSSRTRHEPGTPEENVERLIEQKKIGKAKEAAIGLTDGQPKTAYLNRIRLLEVDSLTQAGNYNGALNLVNLMDSGLYDTEKRESIIDTIIKREVIELIKQKEFKKAKQRAELGSYYIESTLMDQIKLAEKIN